MSKDGAGFSHPLALTEEHPYLTQDGVDRESDPGQYIANLRDGALAGFKYFDFENFVPTKICVQIRGCAEGTLQVFDAEEGGTLLAQIPVQIDTKDWTTAAAPFCAKGRKTALFFRYILLLPMLMYS